MSQTNVPVLNYCSAHADQSSLQILCNFSHSPEDFLTKFAKGYCASEPLNTNELSSRIRSAGVLNFSTNFVNVAVAHTTTKVHHEVDLDAGGQWKSKSAPFLAGNDAMHYHSLKFWKMTTVNKCTKEFFV